MCVCACVCMSMYMCVQCLLICTVNGDRLFSYMYMTTEVHKKQQRTIYNIKADYPKNWFWFISVSCSQGDYDWERPVREREECRLYGKDRCCCICQKQMV